MNSVTIRAPAKLNLTLEVLGRRPDGYHEIRSIVATCSLWDDVRVEAGSGLVIKADDDFDSAGMPLAPGDQNTMELALALMTEERARLAGEQFASREAALRRGLSEVALTIHKRIPASAGLGGGSSDGAATLVALDRFWGLQLAPERLRALAAAIGSDCPFFLKGGVQHLRGRGEELEALPVSASVAVAACIVKPAINLSAKTARLYGLLGPQHYSSGAQSERIAGAMRSQALDLPKIDELSNVFDSVSDQAYGDQAAIRNALTACGALAVHTCGAGPALYGVVSSAVAAEAARCSLSADGYAAWAVTAPAR